MGIRHVAKASRAAVEKSVGIPLATGWGRLMALGIRPPAFVGAYPDYATAKAHAPRDTPNSYDDDQVAPLNFELMSQLHIWDYPVVFWLGKLMQPGLHVVDAGGHFGTKYIAFRDLLPLAEIRWSVQDLPAVIRASRAAQQRGAVPAEVNFIDALLDGGAADVLLASGLLQYLDRPLAEMVAELPSPPRHILLNKVATREGATVVTLEKIGPARLPYQIRNRAAFESELTDMGYTIRASWVIPSLSRRIGTHPGLGASTSMGYYLERAS
ncbi:methyltransferase, TIGR04325 family [Sulfitobacter pseudonitzschiae]|uniref:methyltransferase, TIGR04325 family n=2 Tax=Pseudosulfitobacter pseudonitzschiae TaxID=1402135 RepID=UPI001E457BC1|nr:methyltransferase, TIGR04325 family [Pseudosulfitobacter pseudonitzschiae]MBM1949600.1 methyltransferase, TIGR04325 family [Pseudosulfitobacter pseudonitzschiae]MCI2214454.1 methyltransferase, TIGR04325 family [Pseudosulfitobacter pseudonitzschiae]UFE80292.1 methyltransferase, TIGR04325 family [Pseudosulfitobacter pseudonitzschiae]